MQHPRFIAGDMSTDFIAEEWQTLNEISKQESETSASTEGIANEELAPPQIAAIVGSLLMQEQMEQEKLRRQPATDSHEESSRWRNASRREILR